MILEVSVVAIEIEDNVLIVHTTTEWVTLVIDIIIYMAVLHALLIWPSLLYHLYPRFSLRALRFCLRESILRLVNMSIFAALKNPKSAFVASIAQIGNVSAYLTHSTFLVPWIHNSGVFDHLSSNKDLFSSLTIPSPLPMITLANGTQTMTKGIGLGRPLSSLPLNSVLYVFDSPFNLISISKLICDLNCSITFSKSFVSFQDRSAGRTIGIEHESQGPPSALPWMRLFSSIVVSVIPTFSSSKRWFPVFLAYLQLSESCQLGKHAHVPFPKRLDPWTKSPFELVHADGWGPS